MGKRKSILSIIGAIIVIIFFIFLFIKGSIVTVWLSPKTPITYAIDGYDGRLLKMIFLQDNKTIMYHKDPNIGVEEATLTKMRGTYGTHYFWRFWKIEGPGIILGYRIYPTDVKPVVMETKIIQKYMEGNGDSNFPKINKTTYSTILFGDNSVKFEGMWLQKEETNNEFLSELLKRLEKN